MSILVPKKKSVYFSGYINVKIVICRYEKLGICTINMIRPWRTTRVIMIYQKNLELQM